MCMLLDKFLGLLKQLLPQCPHADGITVLHQRKRFVELVQQFGIVPALLEGQFHAQRLDTRRFGRRHHVAETEVQEISIHFLRLYGLPFNDIQQQPSQGRVRGMHCKSHKLTLSVSEACHLHIMEVGDDPCGIARCDGIGIVDPVHRSLHHLGRLCVNGSGFYFSNLQAGPRQISHDYRLDEVNLWLLIRSSLLNC